MAKLADLRPDAGNANKGTERGRYALEASLRQYGAGRSILLDKHGHIVAGNKTAEVAGEIGIDDVIIVQTDGKQLVAVQRTDLDIDSPEGRGLAYADNRVGELSLEWDAEQMLADINAGVDLSALFRQDELDELLAGIQPQGTEGDTEPEVDRAEELRVKWGVEAGQLWQLGDHRLICGDCTDAATVARVMGGEKAQFCVTSPPYSGAEMWTEETDELIKISHNCLAVIRDFSDSGSALCWNTADVPTGQDGMAINIAMDTMKAIELGWRKRAELIWRKGLSYLPYPWNTRRPCVPNITHESILVFFNGERKARESEGNLNTEQLLWNRESVWDFVSEKASKVHHKAPFPLDIPTRCISLFSFPGDLVYEPFSGSGTTLIACEQLSRRCRAVEISPGYVAVALERWATSTGKTPVLID